MEITKRNDRARVNARNEPRYPSSPVSKGKRGGRLKRYRYYSVERRRNDLSEEYGQDSEMESDPSVTWRPRRALSSEYFIEIMVAADAEMVRYHGKGLLSYILGLMSTVWILFSRIYLLYFKFFFF